jgi:sphingomyelin phosphodiesterase
MKLKSILLACILSSCATAMSKPPPTENISDETAELSVLAYNVYLRPRFLFRDWQLERAQALPARLKGYDVLVLSEVFDTKSRELLIEQLKPEYPYTTKPLGKNLWVTQYGGVMIASRWPIEEEKQLLYGDVCSGSDCAAQKGSIYTRINKNGKRYHIFGTHLQAWPGPVIGQIRQKQLEMLKQFVDSCAIPPSETVLFAGDFNVDQISFQSEYERMLSILNASFQEPIKNNLLYTFDPRQNPLAHSKAQEFLDYILCSNQHTSPKRFETAIVRPSTDKPWTTFGGKDYFDLSDHFAISAKFWFE